MMLRIATGLAAFAFTFAPFAASAAALDTSVDLHASARVGTSTAHAHLGLDASTSAQVSARSGDRMSEAKDRGDQEIERRIQNLTQLSTRLADMKRIASSSQTALSASLEAQVQAMDALKAKIDADDSTTTLRADIQSITKTYRIYALVMPQAAITAAADRALDVATLMTELSAKLSTRLASSTDASLSADLSDMNAKIADATVQAQAAIAGVASLTPDNGDQAIAAANLAALKAARVKVQAAQQDLVAARKDAGTIVKALASPRASATASTSASI